MSDLGNCGYCGTPVYGGRRFCTDRHKAAYHRERDPVGIVGSVRGFKDRTRVILYFDRGELPHLLKPEFLDGSRVVLVPKEIE